MKFNKSRNPDNKNNKKIYTENVAKIKREWKMKNKLKR